MDGKLNIVKHMKETMAKFPGSCHADDLGYLFKTFLTPDAGIQSMEFKALKLMVRR